MREATGEIPSRLLRNSEPWDGLFCTEIGLLGQQDEAWGPTEKKGSESLRLLRRWGRRRRKQAQENLGGRTLRKLREVKGAAGRLAGVPTRALAP